MKAHGIVGALAGNRLRELLGKRWCPLVETAKRRTKTMALGHLAAEEAAEIRRILNVEPGEFWRACRGVHFLEPPPRMVQREFDFSD